ncbi:type II secretion system F family protein [Anaeroarcus burkinensis]|uniref:type II secretion system F family protein n=1 Tax=Anaeroarcus burkinensis TaxID=82376 RepID=UPI00041163CF|nr:type II secretion system F family protein [Anaeroarcus burkinensis]
MAFIIALLIFLTTLLVFWVLRRFLLQERKEISERLDNYVTKRGSSERVKAPEEESQEKGFRHSFQWLSGLLESTRLVNKGLERRLLQAGILLRPGEFLLLCLVVAGGSVLLGMILLGQHPGILVFAVIGYLLPHYILQRKVRQRAKAFDAQLGDALILIANSLRTGYSFMQAMDMVAKEMAPPISEEFARVIREMNLGVATETAMTGLTQRVASEDLDLVVTAMLIQRQIGGNLAEILDKIAGTIRERVRLRGHIRTLTAQGRLSGLIVGLLPFALGGVIFLMNPGYISGLFTNPVGQKMLAVGLFLQSVGVLLIRKIIDIEV